MLRGPREEKENKGKMQSRYEASLLGLREEFGEKLNVDGRAAVNGIPENKSNSGWISATKKSYATGSSNHGHAQHLNQQDAFAWLDFHNDDPMQHYYNSWNAVPASFYPPFFVGYPFPYLQFVPYGVWSSSHTENIQYREIEYYVVIDFEATCDKETNPYPQEIIEFPSVIVNSRTGKLKDWFQTYVRPTYHQHLTDFCKDLTGIQQDEVDKGVSLDTALTMHDDWLRKNGLGCANFAIVTWSNWDCRVMLESECTFKGFTKPSYFNRWINLRVPFHQVFGNVRCNLKEAVQMAGLTWEGRAHCGLDDAKNTARLLTNLMSRGLKISITDSLSRRPECSPSLSSTQFSTTIYQKLKHKPTDSHLQTSTNFSKEKKHRIFAMQRTCDVGIYQTSTNGSLRAANTLS